MNITMEALEACFAEAKEQGSGFVGIAVTIPGAPTTELIINRKENFDNKIEYFRNAYDENLIHKFSANIRMVAFTHGKEITDVTKELVGA